MPPQETSPPPSPRSWSEQLSELTRSQLYYAARPTYAGFYWEGKSFSRFSTEDLRAFLHSELQAGCPRAVRVLRYARSLPRSDVTLVHLFRQRKFRPVGVRGPYKRKETAKPQTVKPKPPPKKNATKPKRSSQPPRRPPTQDLPWNRRPSPCHLEPGAGFVRLGAGTHVIQHGRLQPSVIRGPESDPFVPLKVLSP